MQFLFALYLALFSISAFSPSASVAAWKSREAISAWGTSGEESVVVSASRFAHEYAQGAREIASLPHARIVDGLARNVAPTARVLVVSSSGRDSTRRRDALRECGSTSHATAAHGGVLHHFPTAPPTVVKALR